LAVLYSLAAIEEKAIVVPAPILGSTATMVQTNWKNIKYCIKNVNIEMKILDEQYAVKTSIFSSTLNLFLRSNFKWIFIIIYKYINI
jgi:hypothetical protein